MRFALEPDLEVVGEAGDVAEAVSLARTLQPGVILMDVDMPDACGVAAIETLRTVAPQSAVVVLTLKDNTETSARARAAGAAEFVGKRQTEEALLVAIRRAAASHGGSKRHERASESREEHADDTRDHRDP